MNTAPAFVAAYPQGAPVRYAPPPPATVVEELDLSDPTRLETFILE
jgi:hypothetical protein